MDMRWGFADRPATLEQIKECVGMGWHKLVEDLVADLEKIGWNGTVYQVKEKFGGLRFYIGEGSDAIHERIQQAEGESYRTCEVTGTPGELRTDLNWIRVLCDEEHKKVRTKQDEREALFNVQQEPAV